MFVLYIQHVFLSAIDYVGNGDLYDLIGWIESRSNTLYKAVG